MSSKFSSNSEASASDLLENLEEMIISKLSIVIKILRLLIGLGILSKKVSDHCYYMFEVF